MILMITTGFAPKIMLDERISSEAIYLASTIFLTITLVCWLVCFVLDSGIVEFISVLVETAM